MRSKKASLKRASKENGISSHTVKRWSSSALQKRSSGKWTAKKSDNLLRVLMIPASGGKREIVVRGFQRASQVAKYSAAVDRYVETGDASRLNKFRGKSIKDADGAEIPLLTDRAELNRLGSAGVLSFESLYARST
jgi:hypothetical protein